MLRLNKRRSNGCVLCALVEIRKQPNKRWNDWQRRHAVARTCCLESWTALKRASLWVKSAIDYERFGASIERRRLCDADEQKNLRKACRLIRHWVLLPGFLQSEFRSEQPAARNHNG